MHKTNVLHSHSVLLVQDLKNKLSYKRWEELGMNSPCTGIGEGVLLKKMQKSEVEKLHED